MGVAVSFCLNWTASLFADVNMVNRGLLPFIFLAIKLHFQKSRITSCLIEEIIPNHIFCSKNWYTDEWYFRAFADRSYPRGSKRNIRQGRQWRECSFLALENVLSKATVRKPQKLWLDGEILPKEILLWVNFLYHLLKNM